MKTMGDKACLHKFWEDSTDKTGVFLLGYGTLTCLSDNDGIVYIEILQLKNSLRQ